MATTLADYNTARIMAIKSFVIQALSVNVKMAAAVKRW
jgi:hypothetical protein